MKITFNILMKIKEKFIAALERYLAEKKAKNVYQLSLAAGVDQAALSSFLKTQLFQAGKGEAPKRLKNDLSLESAAKVIEYMDGQLIFPWDEGMDNNIEILKIKKELENARQRIHELEKELYACETVNAKYEALIRDTLPPRHIETVEIRQEKSSA